MSDFLGLVTSLQLAIKAMLMYTASHPRTHMALAVLEGQVAAWLEEKPSVHIAASNGRLFLDGAPFEGTHMHLKALAKQFNEREISGLIIQRGVTAGELEAVLEILILKPSKIEEAGGAAAILASRNLVHVQLGQIQYKEVKEGEGGEEDQGGPAIRSKTPTPSPSAEETATREEVEAASSAAIAAMAALAASMHHGAGSQPGRGQGPQAGHGQGGSASGGGRGAGPAFDIQLLTDQWEEQFDLLAQPSLLEESGFSAAGLGFLGGTPLSIGMGEGFPPAPQMEALRRALLDLPPATLLSVVAGLDSLPSSPSGMRMGFQALAGEAFTEATASLMASDAPWEGVKEAVFTTLRYEPQQQTMLTALEAELRGRGLGMEILDRFREIVQQLDWESLPMDEKIRMATHYGHLWSLTLDQRLTFLRRLLDEGRLDTFVTLVEQILAGLAGEEPTRRETAAHTLKGVTRWLADPGLPEEAESALIQGLTAHFGWEPHLHIHRSTTEALDLALGGLVTKGEPGQALSLLRELANLCEFQGNDTEWRDAALTGLWGRLSDPVSLRKVVELLHTATPETMLTELIPYLEAAGGAACRLLVDILGEEPDRKRRGRLIEAIRGLGEPALPALYEGLDSPTWYLVRNTLNLLADMGDAGALRAVERCLAHPDGRVKRAAVRTLWKVSGPAAVPILLTALPGVDAATQMEILFALGHLRSPLAVPTLGPYALDKKTPEALRVRAAETLGQIGEPKAIPDLTELAMRRGRFFTTAEPTAVRVAACQALLAIGTTSAVAALRGLVAAEPWNKERATLQRVLDQHQPA
jgi:hypothetical protein